MQTSEGQSQSTAAPAPTGTGGNAETINTSYSVLARNRAQAQDSAPASGAQQDSGTTTPGGQQRSEYIPRERFDEVNARRIAAEAQLHQLTQLTQAQAQAAHQANSGGYAPQPQHAPQTAHDFISTLSNKEEQEKWRQKIINQPVTGIAELIQEVVKHQGAAQSNAEIARLQATLAPMQQFIQAQAMSGVASYAQRRAADPNSSWTAVKPVFEHLVGEATAKGYSMTPEAMQLIEGVARAQLGMPMWGHTTATPPFTERPSQGVPSAGQPQVVMDAEKRRFAQMFGMDENRYAQVYGAIGGGAS